MSILVTFKKFSSENFQEAVVFMLDEFIHFFQVQSGKGGSKNEYSLYISCHRQKEMSMGLFVLMAIAPDKRNESFTQRRAAEADIYSNDMVHSCELSA